MKWAEPKERGAGLTRHAGLTRGQILGIDLMNEAVTFICRFLLKPS